MINSPHQDLFSLVPYLCSSIRPAVNSSNKMLSVDQSLMSLSVLSLPGWLHPVTDHDADVIKMSSSVRIPSWCAQPLRNLYDVLSPGWSLPGSQWMGSITGVIWVSESSFMTWVRGETYQFIQSRKVRKGINNFLLLKGIEYRYLFGFRPNSF